MLRQQASILRRSALSDRHLHGFREGAAGDQEARAKRQGGALHADLVGNSSARSWVEQPDIPGYALLRVQVTRSALATKKHQFPPNIGVSR